MGIAILDQLVSFLAKTHEATNRTYRETVFDVYTGKVVRVDKLATVLTAAGKTPDDLRRDVELRHRRAALRPDVDKGKAALRDRNVISAELATSEAEFKAAHAKHADTVNKLTERGRAVDATERASQAARAELLETCDDPDLLAARDDLRRRQEETNKRHGELAADLAGERKRLEQLLSAANAFGMSESNREPARLQAEALQAEIQKREPDLAKAKQELARLEAEQAQLENAMVSAP
jgi:chromosome segregation ATPase